MVFQLITRFRQISSEIELAVEIDNKNQVAELDETIIQTWDQLLHSEPVNTDEARLLAEFFVDQLIGAGAISKNDLLIKRKLLKLL